MIVLMCSISVEYNIKSSVMAMRRALIRLLPNKIKTVLALEPIDFKRHKDMQVYFNKNYINTEIFTKNMGRKIVDAIKTREDSDYDEEFVVNAEETQAQIGTAEELINLVEKY